MCKRLPHTLRIAKYPLLYKAGAAITRQTQAQTPPPPPHNLHIKRNTNKLPKQLNVCYLPQHYMQMSNTSYPLTACIAGSMADPPATKASHGTQCPAGKPQLTTLPPAHAAVAKPTRSEPLVASNTVW